MPQVDHDARPAVAPEGGDAVDHAVGAHLARIVHGACARPFQARPDHHGRVAQQPALISRSAAVTGGTTLETDAAWIAGAHVARR